MFIVSWCLHNRSTDIFTDMTSTCTQLRGNYVDKLVRNQYINYIILGYYFRLIYHYQFVKFIQFNNTRMLNYNIEIGRVTYSNSPTNEVYIAFPEDLF